LFVRAVPIVAMISIVAGLSVSTASFPSETEIQVAFADFVGPRGITLSSGDDDVEVADEPPAQVTFFEPFADVDDALNGKSIRDLISGSPLFSPIEGLPESLWKEKECASCHAWTQETLCDQGSFYNKQGLGAVERKEHPYGGAFKREVMRWADRGCE